MAKPILCVDFDGVIHSYSSGWKGVDIIPDPPVPGALQWLWKATEWFDVQVYSSRSKDEKGRLAMLSYMMQESRKIFPPDHPMCFPEDVPAKYPITFCHEKPAAFLTIDDRSICFDGDWSELEPADLLNFKPWNKREPIKFPGVDPVKMAIATTETLICRAGQDMVQAAQEFVVVRDYLNQRIARLQQDTKMVSQELDLAISDELAHPPRDIMKG